MSVRSSLLAVTPDEVLDGCPVCGGKDSVVVSREGTLYNSLAELTPLVSHLCPACAVIYTNPRLSRETLARFYASEQAERRATPRIEQALAAREAPKTGALVEFVLPYLPPRARVLEVGCGECNVVAALARRLPEGHVTGLDPALDGDAQPCPTVTLLADRLDDRYVPSRLSPPYDCVAAFHVLEHQHDPAAFLGRIGRLLRPGGLLYVEVPHTYRPFWLGKPVETFFTTVHLHNHSRRSLDFLLRASAFEVLAWDRTVPKALRVVARWAPSTVAPALAPLSPASVAAAHRYFAAWKVYSVRRRRGPAWTARLQGELAWRRLRPALTAEGLA